MKKLDINDGTVKTNSHWKQFLPKPIIYVDFHHTITKGCGACKTVFDPGLCPDTLQENVQSALSLLSKKFEIIIFTGYSNLGEVKKWLRENFIYFDKVIFKQHPACFIIDDRAIHHKGWIETIEEIRKRLDMRVIE